MVLVVVLGIMVRNGFGGEFPQYLSKLELDESIAAYGTFVGR